MTVLPLLARSGRSVSAVVAAAVLVGLVWAPSALGMGLVTSWGGEGKGKGQFNTPQGLATDGQGNVYVADTFNARVQKFTSSGKFVTEWGGKGTGDGQFIEPRAVATDPQGNVYVADNQIPRISKFTADGGFIRKWDDAGPDGPTDPLGGVGHIAVSARGGVFTDQVNLFVRIQKFSWDGAWLTQWGPDGVALGPTGQDPDGGIHDSGFAPITALTTDPQGNLYVAEGPGDNPAKVYKFGPDGGPPLATWRPPAYSEDALAVDGEGNIYAADAGCGVGPSCVARLDQQGRVLEHFGESADGAQKFYEGSFYEVTALAADPQGSVYVLDQTGARVTKFSPKRATRRKSSDDVAPVVSFPAVNPYAFRVRGSRNIATISFKLSESAMVRIAVQRAVKGRRMGSKCVKSSRRLARAKRCTRYVAFRAFRPMGLPSGNVSIAFNGLVRGKRVRRGKGRMVITAVDEAGNKTRRPVTAGFRVR